MPTVRTGLFDGISADPVQLTVAVPIARAVLVNAGWSIKAVSFSFKVPPLIAAVRLVSCAVCTMVLVVHTPNAFGSSHHGRLADPVSFAALVPLAIAVGPNDGGEIAVAMQEVVRVPKPISREIDYRRSIEAMHLAVAIVAYYRFEAIVYNVIEKPCPVLVLFAFVARPCRNRHACKRWHRHDQCVQYGSISTKGGHFTKNFPLHFRFVALRWHDQTKSATKSVQ